MRERNFRYFLIFLYSLTIIIFIYFAQRGLHYYLTPLMERPHHTDYMVLKPGGDIGHGLGIVGSAMMVIMLLYSIRKRTHFFNKLGSIAHWLDIHIYFGIFGPLFVILHSSFKVQGLVAISFYSMLAVAISGILGRYLYMQIPRNIRGHELSVQELDSLNQQLTRQLKVEYGYTPEMIKRLEDHTNIKQLQSKSVTVFLWSLFWQDITRNSYLAKIKKEYFSSDAHSKNEIKKILAATKQKVKLYRRIFILDRIQHLFHYWHVIHKPFAVIMIIIMIVHIGIAITFGYTWIF